MLRECCLLLAVPLVCLLGWMGYERTQWDQDYFKYEAQVLDMPPYDNAFESMINPRLFDSAIVLSNSTHLCCPEDLAVSSEGTIYTGLGDGSVVSVSPGSNATTTLAAHP